MRREFKEVPEGNIRRLLKAIEECPDTVEELEVKSEKEQMERNERSKFEFYTTMSAPKPITLASIVITKKPSTVKLAWNDDKNYKIFGNLSAVNIQKMVGVIGNIGHVSEEAIVLDGVTYLAIPSTKGIIKEE